MLPKSEKFQDLPVRVFSALIFGSLAVASIALGGLVTTFFLSICLGVLTWEVFYIFNNGRLLVRDSRIVIPALMFLVPYSQFYSFDPRAVLLIIAISSVIFSEYRLLKFFCILYIGTSLLICQKLLSINSTIPAFYHLFLILSVVAASDIGGYFFGRIFGGPKIFLSISPKKTWTGSVGGVFLAIFTCIALKSFFSYSVIELTAIGFFLSLASQAGDFFESFLKRRCQVKDSGFLLPGHGGFFDRLDGVLAALPVYYGIRYFY